jgi:hypothetical protein
MPELTLHFATADGTDLKAVASHLEQTMSAVPAVEAAEAKPQVLRIIGLPEILTFITLSTTVITSTSALLEALKGLLQAYQGIAKQFPGLHLPTLEVGLRKVPIDQVTEEDAAELLQSDA